MSDRYERSTAATSITPSIYSSSIYNIDNAIPGIVIFSIWTLYIISILLWKLFTYWCKSRRQKEKQRNRCCSCFILGGTLLPEDFQIRSDDDSSGNVSKFFDYEENDLITIVEDEDIVLRGGSYDKKRYDILTKQMKVIRRLFYSLGCIFTTLSVPFTICMLYVSFIFSIMLTRVYKMTFRIKHLGSTIEGLEDKRVNLMNSVQGMVNSLSSSDAESCFQTNGLVEMSRNTIASMEGIELYEDDVSDIKESVTYASGERNYLFCLYTFSIGFLFVFHLTFINHRILIISISIYTTYIFIHLLV